MRHGMRKSRGLKNIWCAGRLIDLNDYFNLFPGAEVSEKIGVSELDETLLNSIPSSWIKKAYVQGFDCEYIALEKTVNMFERMDIAEYIYECLVEPSHKQSTRGYATRSGHIRKNGGEFALSHTYFEMSESDGKHIKR